MMTDNDLHRDVKKLVDDVLNGRVNRRQLLQRAAALGITVPGILMMRAVPEVTAQAATPENTAKPGGKLVAIIVDDPNSLDIQVTQLNQCRETLNSIYETLTLFDAKDGQVKSLLAKDWSFPEPTVLEMNLQPNVKFHNGEDFTADDVKFSIERIQNPDTASPNASIISSIKSVEVAEPLKVRFHLNSPWPALVSDLTTIQMYSKTATQDQITTKPNGTGPFMWVEWVPGDHISYKKNPNYWRQGLPYLDEIEFRPITEQETRTATIEAGDADVMFSPALKDMADFKSNPDLAAVEAVVNDLGYGIYLNNSRAPMSDQNIRLASSYALDRDSYFQSPTIAGGGTPNPSPWGKTHWAYNPINDTAFPFDLDKAKSLLEASGYVDGKKDGTQLSINFVYPAGFPELKDGAVLFQDAMSQLGVDVKVEELELATWIQRIVTTPEYDMSWDYISGRSVDPAWTLSLAFFYPPGPQNISRYKDDQISQLIAAGGSELDQEKRKETYFKFQERWNEISPGIVAGDFVLYHVTRADVKGFYTHPLLFQDFSTVWLDR
jgi:ABC-type transport system substrate-binding protein